MKKLLQSLCLVISMVFVLSCLPVTASATSAARYELPFEADARAYILVSLDTGEVIFEKNSHEQYDPASLTKLLTAYTVYRYVDDFDNTMITAPRYVYDELYGMNSSTADIRQGEILSVKDLMYAMMLPSANEAASILADYVGNGNISNFCMMMNNEARKLGCTNTNFSNPHGLFTENHYTTVYDLYLIAKACYELPGFMDIVTTNTYQMPANVKHTSPYYIQNTNRMQNRAYPAYYRSYVNGMKTGTLDYNNFICVCQKNGENYILVVIGAEITDSEKRPAMVTTAEIMDYFFDSYSLRSANSLTYPVTDIPLKYAKDTDSLLLYADNEVMSVLPDSADESSFRKVYNLPEDVSAPVKSGDVIGTVDYYLAGQKVGTSQLVSHNDVERSTLLYLIGKLTEMFTSLYFRVVVAVTLTLIVIYLIFTYRRFKQHEKMQKVHRRR
ncbi:MAG: D-alanyl-D-alanine carboxypeptidase [Oscillospiraceae bacterium]|nr:D-alanyl-D-alanine carboxypeptidase [Oscillospiraceae bacterium]